MNLNSRNHFLFICQLLLEKQRWTCLLMTKLRHYGQFWRKQVMKKHSWHWMVLWEKHLFFSYLGRGSCDSLFDVVWFMNNFLFCSYHLNMWSLWIIHYLVLFLLMYVSMLEFLWDTTIMIMGYMKKNLGKNNWKTNLVIWILP